MDVRKLSTEERMNWTVHQYHQFSVHWALKNHNESGTEELMLLNCCVGEDSWECLELKGDQTCPSILKESNPEYSLEGLMLKLKLQYSGHPMQNHLLGKDSDAGRDWGQEEKGVTEDEMGWHQRLNGQEFEQTPGDSEGQGSLAHCSPWGHKELDKTEWWTTVGSRLVGSQILVGQHQSRPALPYKWEQRAPERTHQCLPW